MPATFHRFPQNQPVCCGVQSPDEEAKAQRDETTPPSSFWASQPGPGHPSGMDSAPSRLGAHPPSPPPAHGPMLSPSAGPDPSEEAGTKALFRLSDAVEEGAWAAVAVDQQDSTLSLNLTTPANAPIGHYSLSLEASTGYQGSSFMLGQFTLLFNSWCPGELHSIHGQDGEMGRAGPTHGNHLVAGVWWAEDGAAGTSRWTE